MFLLAMIRDMVVALEEAISPPRRPVRPDHIGTTREYGFKTSNAERSWLARHYGVPFEKHGRLYLEPSPINNRLGVARETIPGDDEHDPERNSMTVSVYVHY